MDWIDTLIIISCQLIVFLIVGRLFWPTIKSLGKLRFKTDLSRRETAFMLFGAGFGTIVGILIVISFIYNFDLEALGNSFTRELTEYALGIAIAVCAWLGGKIGLRIEDSQ